MRKRTKNPKLKFSPQAIKTLDDIAASGNKGGFFTIMEGLKQIKRNPEAGTPLYTYYEESIFQKLKSYEQQSIESVSQAQELSQALLKRLGQSGPLYVLYILIADVSITCLGAKFYDHERRTITSQEIPNLTGLKRVLYQNNTYQLELTNAQGQLFTLEIIGIGIRNKTYV